MENINNRKYQTHGEKDIISSIILCTILCYALLMRCAADQLHVEFCVMLCMNVLGFKFM